MVFLDNIWLFQYLISGILSIAFSLFIISRRLRTTAIIYFIFYGITVTVWEFGVYLQRTAPDYYTSSIFFIILTLASYISYPLYLITVLSIRRKNNRDFLLFTPIILMIIALPYAQCNFILTNFGWSYSIIQEGIPFYILTSVFFGYQVAIILSLLRLSRIARSDVLKKKYSILLTSFVVLQTILISLTNYIINIDIDFPPLGGVLNFLTFLFIGFALVIKEEKISIFSTTSDKDFNTVYSSFLSMLYNSTSGTGLGEGSFKFLDFIKESGIEDNVQLTKNMVSFRGAVNLDIIGLINRNLKALEANFVGTEVVDYYLRVLNSAYSILGDGFNSVVTLNEDFLKRSDLVYGIGKGHYLKGISQDNSLENLNDVDACLKIYKRILLLVCDIIRSSNELKKRTSMYYATKTVKVTEYGEVLIYDTEHLVSKVPKEERLVIIIESFNSLSSWVYERILNDPNFDTQEILENLHLVLSLNRKKADELNIYHTFLGRLATRIPKTQIHRFYSDYLEELVESRTGELRDVQKRLLESERLAAIGETAAMVGHDLRNPLQVIFNSTYLLKNRLGKTSLPSKQKESIDRIINLVDEQAQYMNKIVSDLQDYGKPISLEIADCEVEKMVKASMSVTAISQNVKTSVRIEEDVQVIPMDQTLMKRVFVNLIMNAVQAMPDGGQLTIAAHRENENAIISIADTGKGIAEENMGKLFAPLFTTKAKGQGFGLAVCKRIVEAHGGKINVESEINKGANFIITLPSGRKNNEPVAG